MTILLHALICASYLLVAVATAIVLPEVAEWLPEAASPYIGGLLFLIAAIAHTVFAQSEHQRRLGARVEAMRDGQQRLATALTQAQGEANRLREALDTAGREGEQRVSQVVSEVRVLQDLVEKFYRADPARAAAAAMGSRPRLVAIGGGGSVASTPHWQSGEQETLDEVAVLDLIHEALRLDRVDVYLQPVVSLPQRKLRYHECYTRIRARDGRIVMPNQYISIAEQHGLVATIDNMLLFRCVQLVRHTQRRNYKTAFFCNISNKTLSDRTFFRDFIDFVTENAELAPQLVFEFHQADIAHADDEALDGLQRLAGLGFRFSLDQVTHLRFDTAALARRNFRFVKVDADRLLNPTQKTDLDPRDLKALLDRHEIDLIVEKIENEQQLLELLDFRVDYGQGYLFGEPRLARDL